MKQLGMTKTLKTSFEEALAKVTAALKEEGFGVLTEIDVKETLKKKIDADIRRYRILGACNPKFAHRALSQDLQMGLMMPCNVVVHEGDSAGETVVRAIDPMQTLGTTGDAKLDGLAQEVRAALARAIEKT